MAGVYTRSSPSLSGEDLEGAERTLANAPEYVRGSYAVRERRQAELGERLATEPPRWTLEAWGAPRPRRAHCG